MGAIMNVSRTYYLKAASNCEARARAVNNPEVRSEYEDLARTFRDAAKDRSTESASPGLHPIAERMMQVKMKARFDV